MEKTSKKAILIHSVLLVAVGIWAYAPTRAEAIELIENGSFESGDFTGWNAFVTGPAVIPWVVGGAGMAGAFGLDATMPQDGSFVAYNSLEGFGPMDLVLLQDVTLPADHVAQLSWNDRVQWNFLVGTFGTQPKTYEVLVSDPITGEVLDTLFSFSTGTQMTDPIGDTGWMGHTVDLSGFAGETISLLFVAHVPEILTGIGLLEVDAVSLQAEPEQVQADEVRVPVDIKPGGCPNLLNVRRRGVVSVAILGTAELDVTEIDEDSVSLGGVSPLRSTFEDVGTPFEGYDALFSCDDCTSEGADGLLDLAFKFDAQEILAAIEADLGRDPENRECLIVPLSAVTFDGTEILGEDALIVLNNRRWKTK